MLIRHELKTFHVRPLDLHVHVRERRVHARELRVHVRELRVHVRDRRVQVQDLHVQPVFIGDSGKAPIFLGTLPSATTSVLIDRRRLKFRSTCVYSMR